MKKTLTIFLVLLMMAGCLSACGAPGKSSGGKLNVVVTIFPEYDWVKNILGDEAENAEITWLLDKGVDLHSYQPTAEDMMKISDCDVFIYVGGESDEWVEDALKSAGNKDRIDVNLMALLGSELKEEELVEGMEAEEEEESEEEEGPEYDEHVWLSLRNAKILVSGISDALRKADPGHAEAYLKNTEAYLRKLDELDQAYRDAVSAAPCKTLLFGDRFPFRYLTDDYGLDYYAAFVGCSAETEASFATITFLAEKTDELALPAVMTIESSDQKIAKTIVESTKTGNQKLLTMDSLQSVTAESAAKGESYLSVMENNLAVLKEALGMEAE